MIFKKVVKLGNSCYFMAKNENKAMSVMPENSMRNIARKGNHIYFYDEVDEETQLMFISEVEDAVRDIVAGQSVMANDFLYIHINSPGGVVYCGFAIYDYLKSLDIPIITIAEGIAASAASVIFLAGNRRVVTKNSSVLLHQPSWGSFGQHRYMSDMKSNVDKLFDRIIKIYIKETKIGAELPPEERYSYIKNLCEHDYELDSEECALLGISTVSTAEPRLTEENTEKVNNYVLKLLEEQETEELKKIKEHKLGKEKPARKSVVKKPLKKISKPKKTTSSKTEVKDAK